MKNFCTYNNQLMVEIYKGERKLKAKINSGFASVEQKGSLVKLPLLCDAIVKYGNDTVNLKTGQKVLIREEYLYTQQTVIKKYELEGQNFMLIDFSFVVGVE